MATPVVVVQRDPNYWRWFARTAHAKMGALAALLAAVARAHVLPPEWTALLADLAGILAAMAVHYASTSQPPRVPLTLDERDALIEAQAQGHDAAAPPPRAPVPVPAPMAPYPPTFDDREPLPLPPVPIGHP